MTIQCKVKSVDTLAAHTYRVVLTPVEPVDFKAGQYVMVCVADDDKRPFSIASQPSEQDLEFHIGAAEANPWALQVVDLAKQCLADGGEMTLTPPQGDAFLREESEHPLLLVAGGTGFTYVRSILRHFLENAPRRPVFVYWGGRDLAQLYADDEMHTLASVHDKVTYVPVVENADAGWQGKVGNVLDAVCEDFVSLEAYDIYLCGRFEMAGAARERFSTEKGAHRERMYADAFAFI
ncbi:NAD(P)H-flavin reductase [Thaumasiovibrio subtropicus]|uniref:NAD(P)H-flavin reductase n=1 Tax=Thaumasiovibrio subtropicus TaxID=1891207 RepID=UPI000B3633F4|nr:NAD(P)H-flavin reductase [Thaumasiovibrio subtropicus]